jgi:hypothetical protein
MNLSLTAAACAIWFPRGGGLLEGRDGGVARLLRGRKAPLRGGEVIRQLSAQAVVGLEG